MSEREAGSRKQAAGSRERVAGSLDAAIARAVREMLDVEPPPGLRGRVMDRLESPRRGIAWTWLAAPIAAAAVIVIAVMAPWRDAAPPATAPAAPVIAQRETPPFAPPSVAPPAVAPPVIAPRTTEPGAPRAAAAHATRVTPMRPDRLVEAAAAGAVEDMNFTAIDALAGPESIAIERLPDPLPSSMRSIEPAPLQIRALEVTALPETPRERREE